jgi:hypothetical protein
MKNNYLSTEKKNNNNNNKERKLGKYDLKNFNYNNNNNEIENISASLNLNYEKDELTSFENVTIKQSREVSEIQPKKNENKSNKLFKNEKEIDFDNLINQMNLTKSVFDFQDTVRHIKKKSDSNINNTKLTINVPNPNNNNNENIDEYVNNNIINNKNKFINNNNNRRNNKKNKQEKLILIDNNNESDSYKFKN